MTAASRQVRWFWLGLAVALTAAKLWLTRAQLVYAIGPSDHDDLLFLRLADHLARGEWLGPYDQLTLAKGPFYSLWIAGSFLLGVPLFLAQHLLYAAACAVFVRACRPAVPRASLQWALYALLLWNPMSFDASSMGRVLRQHVYGPELLLVFAGLIALALRRAEPWRRQLPWALVAGLAAAAAWLTREESLWLAPSLLLLGGGWLVGAWRAGRDAMLRALGLAGITVVAASLPVLTVCALNKHHYGWFGTVEFRTAAFQDAYGALLRVRAGPTLPYVPVTREARLAAYRVSPTFARLQPYLEGEIGRGWAAAGQFLTQLDPAQGEIGGGWLMWALRDAAVAAGEAKRPGQAMKFYRRVADEINRACDAGQLPAGPRRSGFLPPWRDGQTLAVARTAVEFADFVASFRTFSARPPASFGGDAELQFFRDLTGERISPPAGTFPPMGPAEYALNERKLGALQQAGKALRSLLFGLALVAQGVAAWRVIDAIRRRRWTFALTVAAAAWGACAASVLMHALIQVTSFPVMVISSFAPIYPLLLVFIAAATWDGVRAWRERRRQPAGAGEPVLAPVWRTATPEARATLRLAWWGGLLALVPFAFWYGQFKTLFWFGDDLFLVDQVAAMGLWSWTGRVFAENFVPVFKVLWGGALLGFGGSYAAMLALLWLTHALNTVLLGRLLARAGFARSAILAVVVIFALSAANLETLGWSVQWSAVLATTFLLLGLLAGEGLEQPGSGWSWRAHGPLVLAAAASACSFSRGVLTGPVLALGLLAAGWSSPAGIRRLPGMAIGACVVPAAVVAAIITLFSSGNHQHLAGHGAEVARFAAGYFLLNPVDLLFGGDIWNPTTLAVVAGIKVTLVVGGLAAGTGRVRRLLWLLLAYDLGNALLLGIGRYHTGTEAVLSSRYCYSALLATLPFAGVLWSRLLGLLPGSERLRGSVALAAALALAAVCLAGWPGALRQFVPARGPEMRRLLAEPTTPPGVRVTVPALEFMHVERAKALQRAFDLH